MNWSPQQSKAIDVVNRWLKTDQQVLRLFGYAGTGKTTLAQHLASGAGNVFFAAYTGKAASVMQKKGCRCASTIHSLIYQPADKSRAKLLELQEELSHLIEAFRCSPEYRYVEEIPNVNKEPEVIKLKLKIKEEQERLKRPSFILNPDSEIRNADLVVIDECSMVYEKMGKDLLSFDVPILVLGDPAQLPPVRGGGFFTNQQPDVMLTEIHRQAAGNPVIDLATKVRKGEKLRAGAYGDSLVIDGKPERHLVTGAHTIMVGKNLTRRQVNLQMRRLLGRGQDDLPVAGDKVVCLRNDRDEGLLNGTLWEVTDAELVDGIELMSLSVEDDEGNQTTVSAHTHYFKGIEDQLAYYEIRNAQCFDYGYALTAHKAQGSQWPTVFIFDEGRVFRHNANRWLYTAITRASESVVICRK